MGDWVDTALAIGLLCLIPLIGLPLLWALAILGAALGGPIRYGDKPPWEK